MDTKPNAIIAAILNDKPFNGENITSEDLKEIDQLISWTKRFNSNSTQLAKLERFKKIYSIVK